MQYNDDARFVSQTLPLYPKDELLPVF